MIRTVTIVLLALFCIHAALPAQTPAAANVPWNNYVPARIPDGFRSIIGQQGTTLIPQSAVGAYQQTYQLALPFPFYFIDREYPQGYILQVGAAGFISFNGSSSNRTDGSVGYNLASVTSTAYPNVNKVLAVYWSDLQTTTTSGGGGIYYRLDGTSPSRILTIEWRVSGVSYSRGGVGSFQARLLEGAGTIELFYGPVSLDRLKPAANILGYGAVVGIKNFGQPATYTEAQSNDREKFLLLLNPDPGNQDTVAITRTNTINANGTTPYQSVLYAYYDSYAPPAVSYRASKFFHYSFPTSNNVRIGYRLTMVLDDIVADTAWTSPRTGGQAYTVGSTLFLNARLRNNGLRPVANVPVRADIYRGGSLVAVRTDTAWRSGPGSVPGLPGESAEVSFGGALASPFTDTSDEYVVRIYPQLAGDRSAENDTVATTFYISTGNDVMPAAIFEPISNMAPLFQRYVLGVPATLLIRYVNIGTRSQADVPVGFRIETASGETIDSGTSIVSGPWRQWESRDIEFAWTPPAPGRYYVRAVTMLAGDENRFNDRLPRFGRGKPFDVFYEYEVAPGAPALYTHAPHTDAGVADGRPAPVRVTFVNNGASDATDVPVVVQIRDSAGLLGYERSARVLNVTGGGGLFVQEFPPFIPGGPGVYTATAYCAHPGDPVRTNDTIRWTFSVRPRLSGTIRVGRDQRFRTIQAARDSLFAFGVSGPVTFELTDDSYTVEQIEPTTPALDLRGRVIGLSPATTVTWRPADGKAEVRINLRSASGIGVWYGQLDTSNPSGYITWDGGSNRALRFVYETIGSRDVALPFYFGQGASNYAIRNVRIEPASATAGKKTTTALPFPAFNQPFNRFDFTGDLAVLTSAGIMMRNSAPVDAVTTNYNRRDTLVNQGNVFENNVITGFGYGIVSIGAGPLFVVGQSTYVEYNNRNNVYRNNQISNVGRGGIVVAYERGSEISGNTIRAVANTSSARTNAVGIWSTSGGNSPISRGYSSDLRIERNRIGDVSASVGTGAAILIETVENQLVSPAGGVFRFPAGGNTGMRIRNNIVWNYSGRGTSTGIGLTVDASNRADFQLTGNRIENNTIYNRITGTSIETGISTRGGVSIRNNIVALASQTTSPTALVITAADYRQMATSDYNLFWVPNGNVGRLNIQHAGGQPLPSPAAAKTLQQWRALTGLDRSSVYGDITTDFVSMTAGSEDFHIRTSVVGSIANNRGVQLADLSTDIDLDPRGGAMVRGFDIGADEFNGLVRNNDLQAEEITAPLGYRAATGQFSDAEYQMIDSVATLSVRVRNVGGSPMLSNMVTLTVERWNGTAWTGVGSYTRTANVDVTAAQDIAFGSFMPQTLRELGMTDAFYGMSNNVSPLYRLRMSTGMDDNAANDTYEKIVRFYVRRSTRGVLVSVEGMSTAMPASDVAMGNKLNADSLIAGLRYISWDAANGNGTEDYDLFERDKWPSDNLNFLPWKTIIWAQGEETGGLLPQERVALKAQLDSRTIFDRANLIIAGQEIARQHDVELGTTNGNVADQSFTRTYLRSQYIGSTVPADYSGRRIQGVRLTPGKYETIMATGVAGDAAPMPGIVRATSGNGIAGATHRTVDQTIGFGDTSAGVVSASQNRNVVYYSFDWRHAGRYAFEPDRSGVQRLLLAALDWTREFNGAVPVTLVKMDAYQSGRTAVTVDWQTASEVDVVRMEIERSVVTRSDAGLKEGAWTGVDRKSPEGNVMKGGSYRVVDDRVEEGREYAYRLVTIGPDGQRTVERVCTVKLQAARAAGYTLSVAPNPIVSDGLATIGYTAPAGDRVRIALFDGVGREVTVLLDGESTGGGVIEVEASELPSGSYVVRLMTDTGSRCQAGLVVQR